MHYPSVVAVENFNYKVCCFQAFSKECVTGKNVFLFLNQSIYCGYSKEPSQCDGSFEHQKHMLKVMGKKILKILR